MSGKTSPYTVKCALDQARIAPLDSQVLLAHILKKTRTWLVSHPNQQLTTINYQQFRSLSRCRKKHEPVAYIIGEKEFYGLPMKVNRHVLIPRPETELLVELALQKLNDNPSSRDLVWDVGTGSGAIALALASNMKHGDVLATDNSASALALAKRNAKNLRLKNISFLKADLLDAKVEKCIERKNPSRLIITANLPYLPVSDRTKLAPDVVRYEPASALFTKEDGLTVIRRFLKQLAASSLRPKAVFLEFDPPQAKKISALARQFFPSGKINIHRDLAGLDRALEINF